ncbi:MAG: glycosyltransferase family 4 protein [Geodermatophilaceae bacterium]|nr:glycosyltransferase family 4 protein [Geodermatophilaceae bacterium]
MSRRLKIVLWHGYLLGGTGSNVYTRSLARVFSQLGHEVVVICQDPDPEEYDLAGARVVRPDIGPLLPVFVLDAYAGVEARLLGDLTVTERARVVGANAAALRAELPADLVLVNHVLLGAAVGAASGAPYVVKAHGSELEFAMRGNPELCAWARECLLSARGVIAGSAHIVSVLEEVLGPGPHLDRVLTVPPGVDIDALRPRPRAEALNALVAESRRDASNRPDQHDPRRPDDGNADRLADFLAGAAPTVLYVGKLSREKGVHLLLDALCGLDARTVIVGFGPQRHALEQVAEGRVLFTGALEHRHLANLWPLADVSVTPSVFPEAFGMVAAEAAACGSLPLVARHSGLAELAGGLAEEYPAAWRDLVTFTPDDAGDLAVKLRTLLALSPDERAELGRASRRAAVRLWGWEGIAARLLAAGATAPG